MTKNVQKSERPNVKRSPSSRNGETSGRSDVVSFGRFLDFAADPVTVARRLLGQRLVRVLDGERLSGRIVEVEAYLGAEDRAAHTYNGRRTPRNESMYLPGGHTYIYFIYGMHHCLNVVCGKADEGVAVLIRAIEPEEGVDRMFINRPRAKRERDLCSGPGKVAKALALDRSLDGLDLRTSPVLFIERARESPVPLKQIATAPRIGISYAGVCAKRPLRFFLVGNLHVSH